VSCRKLPPRPYQAYAAVTIVRLHTSQIIAFVNIRYAEERMVFTDGVTGQYGGVGLIAAKNLCSCDEDPMPSQQTTGGATSDSDSAGKRPAIKENLLYDMVAPYECRRRSY